ncbi:Hypothetical predicted protein [Paramuricea clavata]|uniref:Mutator-like transposase domain-containing protein n=1 Tax=Paramuricea clavata TaxID=317549 RepID=A0A7D9J4B9_PARCT|nr:Hypothetical predicted protein [Paramuricea clavata]
MNFYTPSRVNNKSKAFEANRSAVLAAMRNIGVGHQGLVKFCGTMNMLAPLKANSYTSHVTAIHGAAEVVAKASMKSAADETKEFYEPEKDGVYDVAVGILNNGAKGNLDILENLGIKPGCQTKKCLKKTDYDHLRHSTQELRQA